MIRGYRIKIFPKEEQKKMIHKSFGCTRFIYNWCIDRISENYNETKKTLSSIELQKEIVILKKQVEYSWLNEVSANMLKQVTIDCSNAYKRWFKLIKQNNNIKGKPKYKSRKSKQNCPTRTDRMTFNGRYVHLEKIGVIKLSKVKIDLDGKLMNARLSFDGLDYWLSFGVEYKDVQLEEKPKTEPIGIDLGLKTLVYCSNGNTYEKPHTKIIDKKIKHFQRRISKIYQPMIDYCKETRTKFSTLKKSNNLIKLEKELRKYQIRKTNILDSNIHRITSDLIKINPERIVIEDLNVKGMMSNHKLARSIQSSKFYEVRKQLVYKCKNNNIKLIVADRFYPSSKTCSSCGKIKDDLKLKDRVYRCPQCGTIIDRDLNAAINLSRIS